MDDIVAHSSVRRSAEINELAEALAAAQGEFEAVEKNRTAHVKGKTKAGTPYDYTYNYADLGDVLTVALPILSKHGIAFTQPTVIEGGIIYIRTTLMHKSGQWQESDYPVASFGNARHQQIGEALTYAKRYAGCAVLGIAPEETLEGGGDMGGDTEIEQPQKPKKSRKDERPVVVQPGKKLPPVAGAEQPMFLYDYNGERRDNPLTQDQYVAGMIAEMESMGDAENLQALLNHNNQMMAELSDAAQNEIMAGLERCNKDLRKRAAEAAPNGGEPKTLV